MMRRMIAIGWSIALLTFAAAQEDQASAQENRFGLRAGTGFLSSELAITAGVFYDMPRDEQSWFRVGLDFTTYKFDQPPWSSLTLTGFSLSGGYYQYANSNIYWGLGIGVAQTRVSGTGFTSGTSTGTGAFLSIGYKFSENMFAELDFAGGISRLGGASLTVGMFF